MQMSVSYERLIVNTAAYVPVNDFVGPGTDAILLVFSQYSQSAFIQTKWASGTTKLGVSPLLLRSPRAGVLLCKECGRWCRERDEVFSSLGRALFQPQHEDVQQRSLRDSGTQHGGKPRSPSRFPCLPGGPSSSQRFKGEGSWSKNPRPAGGADMFISVVVDPDWTGRGLRCGGEALRRWGVEVLRL